MPTSSTARLCGRRLHSGTGSIRKRDFISSRHSFPKGHGQQSHRDWEVLLAGAVPLIDEPPDTLAALYAGLPVVAVRDWSLVTPHFLEEQWAEIRRVARNATSANQ